MSSLGRPASRVAFAAFSLLIVFCVDIMVPLGVAIGILYVPLLFLFTATSVRKYLLPLAIVISLLIVADIAFGTDAPVSPTWVYLTNRAISLGIVWIVALLLRRTFIQEDLKNEALRREAILNERRVLAGMLPICASCKRIRTESQAWESIEAYIQSNSEATFTHGICPTCTDALYPELSQRP